MARRFDLRPPMGGAIVGLALGYADPLLLGFRVPSWMPITAMGAGAIVAFLLTLTQRAGDER